MHRLRITPSNLLLYLILLFGPIAHGLVETWAITVSHISVIVRLSFLNTKGLNTAISGIEVETESASASLPY
ncbi:MAG: hypothetical protein D3920_02585 [Candidatus Electrothrix sp. AW2]|nr:hypothetical protein [Candidatus Electrothrix gigas]